MGVYRDELVLVLRGIGVRGVRVSVCVYRAARVDGDCRVGCRPTDRFGQTDSAKPGRAGEERPTCFMVTMLCTALVSLQSMTKSCPRIPARKSILHGTCSTKGIDWT
ncbi:MAG: hypothetical protein ABGY24_11595 [bacterium]